MTETHSHQVEMLQPSLLFSILVRRGIREGAHYSDCQRGGGLIRDGGLMEEGGLRWSSTQNSDFVAKNRNFRCHRFENLFI